MRNSEVPAGNRRRMPRQARSLVTVEVIFEATIQVLLSDGPSRINTTKIAERAGVSVGTLYQYFPNKQSLFIGLLERTFSDLAAGIEAACDSLEAGGVEPLAEALVKNYLRLKSSQARLAPALYFVAADYDATALADATVSRSTDAIYKVLKGRTDQSDADCAVIARTTTAVLFGTVPVLCPRVLTPEILAQAEGQLVTLLRAYLSESTNFSYRRY